MYKGKELNKITNGLDWDRKDMVVKSTKVRQQNDGTITKDSIHIYKSYEILKNKRNDMAQDETQIILKHS